MRPTPDRDWKPDPQLLAAYFDGELEGCADAADLRVRLETWLEQHPEASADANEYRRLRKIVWETAPEEPGDETWKSTLDSIDDACHRCPLSTVMRNSGLSAVAGFAAIALIVIIIFGVMQYLSIREGNEQQVSLPIDAPGKVSADDNDVLPVANFGDVLILRIDGRDTNSVVVGELPMSGPMELAAPGEVRVLVVKPDERDGMPRIRQDASSRPMIYARLDSENE